MSVTKFIYRQGSQRIQKQALLDEIALKVDRKHHTQLYVQDRAAKILHRVEVNACKFGIQQFHEYTVEKDDSNQD